MSVVLNDGQNNKNILLHLRALFCAVTPWFSSSQVAESSERLRTDMVYEIGELFELGIQLSYLLILLGLLGVGTFFVIRQVLVRRELDLSAKELQVNNWFILLTMFHKHFTDVKDYKTLEQTDKSNMW